MVTDCVYIDCVQQGNVERRLEMTLFADEFDVEHFDLYSGTESDDDYDDFDDFDEVCLSTKFVIQMDILSVR